MSYSSDVLIIGAGVGGLSLALRLAAKGYRIRILQQREPSPSYRPEMVQPAGLQAFADLGLLDRLQAKKSARVDRFHFYRIQGERLCQVNYRILDHPYPYALVTLPHQIRRVLLEGLRSYSNVCIHWDTLLTEVQKQGSRVIGAKAIEGGRDREFNAFVTIGSDGSASRLRHALGIRCRSKRYSNAFLGLLIKRPERCAGEFSGQVHYYLGLGEILGIFPCSRTELCLLYMVPADSVSMVDKQCVQVLKGRLAGVDQRLEDSLMNLSGWEQVSLLFPVQVRAAKWVTDGAALLGDAAHACHPHVAQGSYQAMEDGKVLAEVLGACFGRGDFSVGALAPYEQARRPVIEQLQRVASEYVWLWETRNPVLAGLRDRIFRNIGNHPGLLAKVAATEAGILTRPLTFRERIRAIGLCA